MKRKTHTDYVEEVSKINPNIEVLGRYKNAKTKILHKCKIDGYEWFATPDNILNGNNCPKCSKNEKKLKRSKTHEWYLLKVFEINPNIEILGTYEGYHTKILHKCKKDEYEWYAAPSVILKGHGCPECAILSRKQKRRKAHENYISEVAEINPNIEVIGEYVNTHTKILHRCKIDGYDWYVEPSHVLSGNNCPVCAKISMTQKEVKKHEDYVKEVAEVNPNIEVIGEYINSHTPIIHRCKIDDYKWYSTPTNILTRGNCPKCNSSIGEYKICKYLTERNINYILQYRFDDCKNKRLLPFDFYLPDYNVCIEFDGIQHFKPVEYFGGVESLQMTQLNDSIKTKYCKDKNIELLRIKYDQNIKEVLDMFLNRIAN